MIQSIAHAAITVKDMELSVRFYTEALGFKKAFEIANPKDGSPWIVYLNLSKGQFVELFYNGTTDNPWHSDLIGFQHLCFQVDDIDAATKQIIDAGFEMDQMPKVGCDFNKQAWVVDPNGVRVELMQIDPRSPHYQFM